jgi:hypothetical protein
MGSEQPRGAKNDTFHDYCNIESRPSRFGTLFEVDNFFSIISWTFLKIHSINDDGFVDLRHRKQQYQVLNGVPRQNRLCNKLQTQLSILILQ